MIDGIINVYKEAGFTSFDVVAKLRGILKQKKIGHTGTLDPDATGVLPVCVGSATKLCDLLTDRSKEYVAELLLGVTTDTLDTTGKVLSEQEVNVSEEEVRQCILNFQGEYDQIPPMYSALKVNGQKLCDLARKGKEVERQGRRVTIEEIEILSMELPVVKFRVICSKGTYIRSLCDDIGRELGLGGTMKSLVRTRVSAFEIENALTLSEIEDRRDAGTLDAIVMPVDTVFMQYAGARITENGVRFLSNGNVLTQEELEFLPSGTGTTQEIDIIQRETAHPKLTAGDYVRIYDREGRFTALYEVKEDGMLKPYKMFLARS